MTSWLLRTRRYLDGGDWHEAPPPSIISTSTQWIPGYGALTLRFDAMHYARVLRARDQRGET